MKKENQEIRDYIQLSNNDFSPPLSHKTNLKDYIEKLIVHAEFFLKRNDNDQIIALAACYFNDENGITGFLSYINVKKEFQGAGIADTILNDILKFGYHHLFHELLLEVDKTNERAIHNYRKHNFEIHTERIGSFLLKKKIR